MLLHVQNRQQYSRSGIDALPYIVSYWFHRIVNTAWVTRLTSACCQFAYSYVKNSSENLFTVSLLIVLCKNNPCTMPTLHATEDVIIPENITFILQTLLSLTDGFKNSQFTPQRLLWIGYFNHNSSINDILYL